MHPSQSTAGPWASRARLDRVPQSALELALVAVAAAVYGGVRALTEGSVERAVENGEWLLRLERSLGLAWEDAVQSWALSSDTLVDLANWVYIWGHWPVIVASAVILYHTRRASYVLLRNAVFVSAAIGFLFFALCPVAPPRLIDAGLLDTVLERSESYRALQPPALTNQYAAFPSLHFGWNLLVGIVLFVTFSRLAVRIFAVAMPSAMALAVVASANHYVLDVVGGGVIVVVGIVVATAIVGERSPAAVVAKGHAAPAEQDASSHWTRAGPARRADDGTSSSQIVRARREPRAHRLVDPPGGRRRAAHHRHPGPIHPTPNGKGAVPCASGRSGESTGRG
jgi:hypothetical protein